MLKFFFWRELKGAIWASGGISATCCCGMSHGGAAAKTALVAPLLRAGKAVMWRFQPLCRARWPFVGEPSRGGARRADPFSVSVRRSMAPARVGEGPVRCFRESRVKVQEYEAQE